MSSNNTVLEGLLKGITLCFTMIGLGLLLYMLLTANTYAPFPSHRYLALRTAEVSVIASYAATSHRIDDIAFNMALKYEEFDAEHGDEKLILLHDLSENLDKRAEIITPLKEEAGKLQHQQQALWLNKASFAERRAFLGELRRAKAHAEHQSKMLHILEATFSQKILALRALTP